MMNIAEKPQLTIPRVIGCLSFFNADNLEIMRGFKDNEFDLAIVDPPYENNDAIGLKDNTGVKKQATKRTNYKVFENIANPCVTPNCDLDMTTVSFYG